MAPVSRIQTAWHSIPESLQHGIMGWLCGRTMYVALGLVLEHLHLMPDGPARIAGVDLYFDVLPLRTGWEGMLLGIWQRWDAIHYIRIAENGYSEPGLSAFFPLYPFLGGYISLITGLNKLSALLLINDLAVISTLTISFVLARELYSVQVARRCLFVIISYPGSFFLFAPYADGLSLMYILLAVWGAKHSRWVLVGVSGLSAGLTRPTVLPLAVFLMYVVLQEIQQTPHSLRTLGKGLAGLSPVIGMFFFEVWRRNNGFEPYLGVQGDWGWAVQFPWEALLGVPRMVSQPLWGVLGWITFSLFIVQLIVFVRGFWVLPFKYTLYVASSILFLLMAGIREAPLSDWIRHSLLIFPFFICLGWWLERHQKLYAGWLIVSLMLQFYLCYCFFMWFPV